MKTETNEVIIKASDDAQLSTIEVPGGLLYHYQTEYFRKNQFGQTSSITFVPYGPLKRLSIWLKSLF